MCIAVWYTFPESVPTSSNLRFVLLFNRDEYFHRKTQLLHPWPESDIIAGRDYDDKRVATNEHGTWLGINCKTKRICFLTNVLQSGILVTDDAKRQSRGLMTSTERKKSITKSRKKSRGVLVKEILEVGSGDCCDTNLNDYMVNLDMSSYGDAHVFVASIDDAYRVSHKHHQTTFSQFRDGEVQCMSNSCHSNDIWKKQTLAQKRLQSLILESTSTCACASDEEEQVNKSTKEGFDHDVFIENCFHILQDIEQDNHISDLDLSIAKRLIAIDDTSTMSKDEETFCRNYQQVFQDHSGTNLENIYGTRSSTVVLVYANDNFSDKIRIIERSKNLRSNIKGEENDNFVIKRLPPGNVFENGVEVTFLGNLVH